MPHPRNSRRAALVAVLVGLAACNPAPSAPQGEPAPAAERASLGLMTSLPLYWPLGAGLEDIAAGAAPPPWQRTAIEAGYALVPLDTLSPIPALSPDQPDSDPLAQLDRLAVIQPRGLSPADNVALDRWVRAGGRLLLALDPALTGEYDLPLGDPRRPTDSALIPPAVARWGLAVSFDEAQPVAVDTQSLAGAALPLALSGQITAAGGDCTVLAQGAAARCRVGEGQVTLIADAALFEHPELAGEGGADLLALLVAAFEPAGKQAGLGKARESRESESPQSGESAGKRVVQARTEGEMAPVRRSR